jgi:hypothetical protein
MALSRGEQGLRLAKQWLRNEIELATGVIIARNRTPTRIPTREFPIQRTIQKLEKELHAFNERIAELEDESHNSRAIKVLKENALDFARRIDELRSVLVEQAKKTKS